MLTSRGITVLTGAGLAWLAGRALGIAPLYAVSVTALAVVVLGVAAVRLTTSAIAARRVTDVRAVVAGSPLEVTLELRNDGRVPSPALLVADALPPGSVAVGHDPVPGEARFVLGGLGPRRVVRIPYRLVPRARGRFAVGPVAVRVTDPFAVAERTRRYTSTTDVVVYPRIERLAPAPVRGAHMGAGSSDTRRVFATGEDFYTMREYVRGDDLRHVHWPSTAHRQTLMVRQMEQPWQAHATIHLDVREHAHTDGPDGTLEQAVSIAASMVYGLADEGYQLRLVTDRTAGRVAPTGWAQALEALAVLPPSDSGGLGPSLASARGGEGLLVSILGVPPGRGELTTHPDMRALFGVRGFGQRIALVVTPPDDTRRGDLAVGLLRGAGWSAQTVTPGQALAPVWEDVAGRRTASAGGRR